MKYKHQAFPSWRYGPNGEAIIVNSEDETPKGFSAERKKSDGGGTNTAIAPPNGTTSAEEAAKTTTAKSQTATDPAVAAKAGVGGAGNSTGKPPVGTSDETNPDADPSTIELDTDGHAYDPSLHAKTKSKTKDGRWRMKVGVKRPAPAAGYPLDL